LWIGHHLDVSEPLDDVNRRRRARSSPAVQIEYEPGICWIADRIVVTTELAVALDRGTLPTGAGTRAAPMVGSATRCNCSSVAGFRFPNHQPSESFLAVGLIGARLPLGWGAQNEIRGRRASRNIGVSDLGVVPEAVT
jgi:hypothetical protein